MAVCSDGRWRVNERPVLDREEEDVWDPGEPLRYPIRDHFGRSGQKWSGRVWGSLASNSKVPSATTSVGLDESGPAECGGHLRAIQRYHPRPLRSVWTKVVRPSVGVTCEQFKDTIRDHFGRSGRKWSGRVWVTCEPFNDAPSATTSVGLDKSGPAECGGHLRAIQRYHPRPLRSVWTKMVRPSVGVTCEQFKDTIRDHFGRFGQKWSGRVWGSLASNSKIPSATTSVGLDENGPAECGGHLRAIQRYHPRPLRSVWTKVVRPSVGVTCEQFKDTIRDHFGRFGRKWSGRVWGSLASNSKIPSATTSVGLDESGPAECGGHLRAIQRYHPRPLRSVWTKVVRPSVGVTCEQFKDTIRDHFGRSGRKWSGRVGVRRRQSSGRVDGCLTDGRDDDDDVFSLRYGIA